MAARKVAEASGKPALAAGRAGGAGDDQHYEGKLHYPAAVYGKKPDGKIVSRRVETAAEFAALRDEDHAVEWATNPADHGLETHPTSTPIAEAPVADAPIDTK